MAVLWGLGSPTKLGPGSWPVSHGLSVDVGVPLLSGAPGADEIQPE